MLYPMLRNEVVVAELNMRFTRVFRSAGRRMKMDRFVGVAA